jgi:hypothetical protein
MTSGSHNEMGALVRRYLLRVMGCQSESDRHGCPAQMSDLAGRRTEGDWLGD